MEWIFSLEDSTNPRQKVRWDENWPEEFEQVNLSEANDRILDVSRMTVHHAPQFPVTSASNIKAVAAHDVPLQHHGQKIVHGHVTTNSGEFLYNSRLM